MAENAKGSRIELHPETPGFDVELVSAALSWLDPMPNTLLRSEIIATIRTMLEIVLAGIPYVTDRRTQEIKGLPSKFDLGLRVGRDGDPAADACGKNGGTVEADFSLGAPAHDWVERFYWQWFTTGWKAKPDFADFFSEWRAMIEFAPASPQWDRKKNWHHAIDAMVYELLGFDVAG